jgi:hypothetical protein
MITILIICVFVGVRSAPHNWKTPTPAPKPQDQTYSSDIARLLYLSHTGKPAARRAAIAKLQLLKRAAERVLHNQGKHSENFANILGAVMSHKATGAPTLFPTLHPTSHLAAVDVVYTETYGSAVEQDTYTPLVAQPTGFTTWVQYGKSQKIDCTLDCCKAYCSTTKLCSFFVHKHEELGEVCIKHAKPLCSAQYGRNGEGVDKCLTKRCTPHRGHCILREGSADGATGTCSHPNNWCAYKKKVKKFTSRAPTDAPTTIPTTSAPTALPTYYKNLLPGAGLPGWYHASQEIDFKGLAQSVNGVHVAGTPTVAQPTNSSSWVQKKVNASHAPVPTANPTERRYYASTKGPTSWKTTGKAPVKFGWQILKAAGYHYRQARPVGQSSKYKPVNPAQSIPTLMPAILRHVKPVQAAKTTNWLNFISKSVDAPATAPASIGAYLAPALAASSEARLATGTRVYFHHLKANSALNGKHAVILQFEAKKRLYQVMVEGTHEKLFVKPASITADDEEQEGLFSQGVAALHAKGEVPLAQWVAEMKRRNKFLSHRPTSSPSSMPTAIPSATPSTPPTTAPTIIPSSAPTSLPTNFPTSAPTNEPTVDEKILQSYDKRERSSVSLFRKFSALIVQHTHALPYRHPAVHTSEKSDSKGLEIKACTDSVKNNFETDIDCGGWECKKCNMGQSCRDGITDCKSGACEGKKCVPESALMPPGSLSGPMSSPTKSKMSLSAYQLDAVIACTDSVKNNFETDIDCGGSECKKCNVGQSCRDGTTDCKSGVCEGKKCVPERVFMPTASSTSNVTNGNSTDDDDGGDDDD